MKTDFTNLNKISICLILFVSFGLSVSGCKKAVPELKSLAKLKGFSVNQSNVSYMSKANPNFQLSGSCDKNIKAINISFDDGSSWLDMSSVANLSLSCSEPGSFQANFLTDLSNVVSASVLLSLNHFLVRGSGDYGYTENFRVGLTQGGFGFSTGLSSASASQEVGGYLTKVRVGYSSDYQEVGAYKVRIEVR